MRDCTKIVIVLDRSGSMSSVQYTMEEVLNGFIANQQQLPGECCFSLVQFDDQYEKVLTNVPIKDVGKLSITPRGSTALLDAIGQTIDDVGAELSNMQECDRPNKVMFVVLTDGFENASCKYIPTPTPDNPNPPKASRINAMVKHQREVYSWQFIFLGADQDAIATAANMGFDPKLALNYSNNSADIKGLGSKLCRMSSAYRAAPSARAGGQNMGMIASETQNRVTAKDTQEWEDLMKKSQSIRGEKNGDLAAR